MSPSSQVSEFSEEIIEEILVKLPAQSLLRFKTVSKQWLALITSNSFAVRQHQIQTLASSNISSFLLYNKKFINPISISLGRGGDPRGYLNIDFPLKIADRGIPLQHYSLVSAGYGIYCIFHYSTAFLWNPTTKKINMVPPSPFHTSKRDYCCRFGTVEYKDGNFYYKVGRVVLESVPPINTPPSFSLEFYSSKTKSWKLIPDFFSMRFIYWNSSILNFNGKAHWVVCPPGPEAYVMTFDYETEVIRSIKTPLPPKEIGGYYEKRCIVTLFDDKFLCLLLTRKKYFNRCLDVWVMRNYESEDSWTIEFTFKLVSIDVMVPLGISSKLQCIILDNFMHSPPRLILYDYKSSSLKQCYIPCEKAPDYMEMVDQDVDSLVSLAT